MYHLLLKSQHSHEAIIFHFRNRERAKFLGEECTHTLLLLAIQPQPLDPLYLLYHQKVFVVGQVVAEFGLYNLFQEQKQGRTFRNRKDVWSSFSLEAGYRG